MAPKLEPLRQWICDSCEELIEQPDHGYLEWRDDRPKNRRMYGFRVVHHAPHSPRRKASGERNDNCYYSNQERGGDLDLPSFLGAGGRVVLSSWIDVGEEIDDEYRGPEVDLREWTVLFRRLHVPYYEEARQYLARARREGFGECNEVNFYMPETLKAIIEEFSEDDNEAGDE